MNKRRILIVAVAVCLVAILACGSLAYFTAKSDTVTNKFYTYSTDDFDDPPTDPDQLFSIEITETGAAQYGDDNEYYGKVYEEVLPGSLLDKDPKVTNTGKYPAYVRLRVTLTNAKAWQKACQEIGLTDLSEIFIGFDEKVWDREDAPVLKDDELTYVYYLREPLEPAKSATLFTQIQMPGKLTVDHMIALSQFQLIIEGDAIQSENTGANAYETFTNTKYWPAS